MEKDQKLPDGTCHGRDLPDCGVSTGVTDTYGANLEAGYGSAPVSIVGDTGSDPAFDVHSPECYVGHKEND